MKKSALNLAPEEDLAFAEPASPFPKLDVSKIIVYEPPNRSPVSVRQRSAKKGSRRQRKLARFIKLEAGAFFFLIVTLAGATSDSIHKAGFGSACEIGMIVAALIVAIVPVLFYGSTSEKYRYRTRRYRSR